MGPEVIVSTLVPLTLSLLILGIVYLRNKENMALIERGINPRITDQRPRYFINLKWGLLLSGAGLGLLIAYFIDSNMGYWYVNTKGVRVHHPDDNPAIYFSLIAIGGGLGLVTSFLLEKKHWDKKESDKQN